MTCSIGETRCYGDPINFFEEMLDAKDTDGNYIIKTEHAVSIIQDYTSSIDGTWNPIGSLNSGKVEVSVTTTSDGQRNILAKYINNLLNRADIDLEFDPIENPLEALKSLFKETITGEVFLINEENRTKALRNYITSRGLDPADAEFTAILAPPSDNLLSNIDIDEKIDLLNGVVNSILNCSNEST